MSQQVSGTTKTATRVHTNAYCAGYLPKDHEALVFGIRAVTDLDTPLLRAWANRTVVSYKYNSKSYLETSLFELLRKRSITVTNHENEGDVLKEDGIKTFDSYRVPAMLLPVHMRSLMNFEVTIESEPNINFELRRSLERELIVRVHLDGLFRRSIV